MTLMLHNTLTRAKEPFRPLDPKNVRLYVCGPTVYDRAHIGNARPVVVFDVLFRLLRHLYGPEHVTYARNITDIDDKIIERAVRDGVAIDELTRRTTAQFHEDMDALGALRPTVEPRATQHVGEMIALIERLIERGHAYEAEGHVLFDVPSMPDYGRLSGRNRDEQIAGARVDVAPYKRDPADFVLWKPSSGDQPGWDSPWGRGRPGWHLECSAMSHALLGEEFDIHGGGLDLVFPHHENEIAQSRCGYDGGFARVWMHNGYVVVNGEKMSKSLGNFFTVRELLDKGHRGEAIRLALLSAHYRQPLDLSIYKLEEAKTQLDRFYSRMRNITYSDEATAPPKAVEEALEDDLNTPLAIARLHELASAAGQAEGREKIRAFELLKAGGDLLGILQHDAQEWFQGDRGSMFARNAFQLATRPHREFVARVESLIRMRAEARKAKKFAEADRIRDELASQGILLEDSAEGTTWKRAG